MDEKTRQKEIGILKASYDMYEKTKKESAKKLKTKHFADGSKMFDEEKIQETLDLMNNAEADIIEKYKMLGGNIEDLTKPRVNKKVRKKVDDLLQRSIEDESFATTVQESTVQPTITTETQEFVSEETVQPNKTVENIRNSIFSKTFDYNPQASYDVIPLPSKGECYKSKRGNVPVAYLTAYDENMIIAPNLYKDNKIIDMMLKTKVVDNRIDTFDMLEGDREAIILFLRASGYGNEYPITAIDNETGIEFETTVDLSSLKFKDFKLKGDENGWFDYTLPISKKQIKFRFLTHKDIVLLEEAENEENKGFVKAKIKSFVEDMDRYIEDDEDIKKADKIKVKNAIRAIEEWEENMEEDDENEFGHSITNRLELSIMAVDGVTDRTIVRDFVRKMNVRDSSSLRKYITENEPGFDHNITIEKPESLGGGSMTVFLQLDQYIFLNIA